MNPILYDKARAIYEMALHQKRLLATAESCTGGLIAALFTEIPGVSKAFERGFVTYSNESKHEMLGIPLSLIEDFGAVSSQVAQAMAEGALKRSRAYLSLSVTGIAGPDGGSEQKPVGLVYIASACTDGCCYVEKHQFSGNRRSIREAAANAALDLLTRQLSS